MGEILQFEVGCRHCVHLVQVNKNSFMCSERVHMDDTPVMPIVDGEKSFIDWNVCHGEYYQRASKRYSKMS